MNHQRIPSVSFRYWIHYYHHKSSSKKQTNKNIFSGKLLDNLQDKKHYSGIIVKYFPKHLSFCERKKRYIYRAQIQLRQVKIWFSQTLAQELSRFHSWSHAIALVFHTNKLITFFMLNLNQQCKIIAFTTDNGVPKNILTGY